jgi:hypothetical protein
MSRTQTARTYVPSVRGDAMLLTHGRKGAPQDLLLAGAAVVLDGALGGHIDVVGRRAGFGVLALAGRVPGVGAPDGVSAGSIRSSLAARVLGRDRRRVVPASSDPDAPLLMAELRERVASEPAAGPRTWFDRASVFAHERVAAELAGAGATTPLRLNTARRVLRHDTLLVCEPAELAARDRLFSALAGRGTPTSIALGAALLHTGLLTEVAGPRDTRRLRARVRTLPRPAQTFLAALRQPAY